MLKGKNSHFVVINIEKVSIAIPRSMFIPDNHIVYIENYEYWNERGLRG